ncbi:MAG: hypothetical protein ABI432_07620 [Flavobacteriales bacterium]
MDLKRRLQLYLIGLIIGGTAAYFMLGDRLTNGAWTPEQKVKQRLRSTLVSTSPMAASQLVQWPADLAAVRLSLDSADIQFNKPNSGDTVLFYAVDARVGGRDARMTIRVNRDFDRDSTATLTDLRPR